MNHVILLALPELLIVIMVLIVRIFYYTMEISKSDGTIIKFLFSYVLLFMIYLPTSAFLIEPYYKIGPFTKNMILILFNIMFVSMAAMVYRHEYTFTKKYKKI